MLNDLRFALRQLRRTPGVAAIAMLSLGLAIGANSTIACVVNAVLLRPLPVPKPNELPAYRAGAREPTAALRIQ
ncbi:MAG TPA: hypothetical protein VL173_15840 [Vicinamibacterales bacterium]|nr:hypothetical protein [Vicinamibacterales bacterium]